MLSPGYKADQERLSQSRASLEAAKLNLEHTVIRSPISGTIISRSVDRGQTVAAAMSAPTLFTIGEDLTKMQVNTAVDEADVGKLKAGMNVTFTVDAFPGENFSGTISQVRLSPTTVNNIVTYNTILDVANPQLKLKPGMTANVKIIIRRVDNILKIPNAALRFKPSPPEGEMSGTITRTGHEGPGESSVKSAGVMGASTSCPGVPAWTVAADGAMIPVFLRLGLTDGVSTQVISGNLKEGDKVVTGEESSGNHAAASQTKSQTPGFGGPGMGGPPPPP